MSTFPAHDMPWSDDPQTTWLTEPNPDRQMVLLREFWFVDRHNRKWLAAAGSIVDGASIPRALWTLVGSPYTGDYRRASIVHDVACVEAGTDRTKRRAADRMFYWACRAGGCSVAESYLLYLGVRIGAHLTHVLRWQAVYAAGDSDVRLARSPEEQHLESDYCTMGQMIQRGREVDDPAELERRVDQALTVVTGVDPLLV
jgi:Protein of unknown function (DUF1353)